MTKMTIKHTDFALDNPHYLEGVALHLFCASDGYSYAHATYEITGEECCRVIKKLYDGKCLLFNEDGFRLYGEHVDYETGLEVYLSADSFDNDLAQIAEFILSEYLQRVIWDSIK